MKQHLIELKLFFVIIASALVVGCAFNTAPRFDVEPSTGTPVMVKRYPKYPLWQELLFWKTKEYYKNTGKIRWLLSEDQKKTIARYGQPDYFRRVFFSTRFDRVHEWLYWDKQRVVQFVNGQLVWDGQLTDFEKILLLHGRPTKCIISTTEELNSRKVWLEYTRFLGLRQWCFFFVNDRLITGQELI